VLPRLFQTTPRLGPAAAVPSGTDLRRFPLHCGLSDERPHHDHTIEGDPVSNANDDPVIRQLRDQISDNDLKIFDGINKRLKLVAQLWAYKRQKGLEIVAPGQEEWLITFASRANKGPLSPEGLREIYRALLDLTKRELDSGA
jgi:chorismate mutase